ncbi:MAG: dTDP-4-dehydrorhamnose reductase [Pseudomonadota bacterium]
MKILITGANGQLGTLLREQAPQGIELAAFDSKQLDIGNAGQVRDAINLIQPAVIINAAAYTQVDKAESEREAAWRVNEQGVTNLVAATKASTRILHVSTDFVFDGSAQQPYRTSAATNPLSAYGASKLAGEQVLVNNAADRSCIVRTAWLYSAGSKNFMNTMLMLMQTRDSLRVVSDQRGTPTAAGGLAAALWRAVQLPALTGICHWTDDGETTWHGFASEIQRLGLQYGLLQKAVPIQPIATSEFPTPATRPAYSVLEKESTFAALGMRAQPWQLALEQVIARKAAETAGKPAS